MAHGTFPIEDAGEIVAGKLAQVPLSGSCCARTESVVMLHRLSDGASGRYIVRGERVAERLRTLLWTVWGVSCRVVVVPGPDHRAGSRAYAVETATGAPPPYVASHAEDTSLVRPVLLARSRDCCRLAALRAAFLADGTVIPGVRLASGMVDRHIELGCSSEIMVTALHTLVSTVARRPAETRSASGADPRPVVVLHGVDATRQLLTAIGLEWTPDIQRLLRNTYCTGPTADHVREALARVDGTAPTEVLEAARLRLASPNVSLTTLSRLNGGRPSVRTLTLRLNRLMALAGSAQAAASTQATAAATATTTPATSGATAASAATAATAVKS